MKVKWPLVLLLLLCASPSFPQTTNALDTRMALLEQTQQQQDEHMRDQDRRIEKIQGQVNELASEQAQNRGVGLTIMAILGLLQLVPVLMNLKSKQKGG